MTDPDPGAAAPALPEGYRIPPDEDGLLDECDVSYFQSSGPGGQHRNRNRTAVRLRHRPSGLVVIGRRQRSRRQNVRDALDRLRARLAGRLEIPTPRVATRPSRAARKRRLDGKRRRSATKRLRGSVDPDD